MSQKLKTISVGILAIICHLGYINGQGGSLARSSEYRDGGGGEILESRSPALNSHEPSCEELRAMWRFSKRQSRAAEITNEIPTYRDPFAYNVWEPYYPTTRSLGGIRVNARYRDMSRPVFGRILHKEPVIRFRDIADRSNTFGDISRLYGAEHKINGGAGPDNGQSRRRVQFRFSGQSASSNGGGNNGGGHPNGLTPQKGSFQRLKELVWTERARELAQQRKAEEMAARAAVLKEIANGHGYGPRRQEPNKPIVRGEGYDGDVLPPMSGSTSTSQQSIPSELNHGLGIDVGGPVGDSMYSSSLTSPARTSSSALSVPQSYGSMPSSSKMANERSAKNTRNTFTRFNDNSWISSSNLMRRPPSFRERNRSKLRHGFPDVFYGALHDDQLSDELSSENVGK